MFLGLGSLELLNVSGLGVRCAGMFGIFRGFWFDHLGVCSLYPVTVFVC